VSVRWRSDSRKWEVRWRENGRNRSKSFTLKSDAARFHREIKRARELGGSFDPNRGKETLADFIEQWWREYALVELEASTRTNYARVWEIHLRPRVGGYGLRDVSPAVVDALKAELVREGVGAPTIRKALAILSGVFRCAVLWDRIDRNPVREVRLPTAKRSRYIRPIHPANVERMRAALIDSGKLRDATLLTVLAYAGLRPEGGSSIAVGGHRRSHNSSRACCRRPNDQGNEDRCPAFGSSPGAAGV
jgi:site-specific recombinase XerD